MYITLRAHYNEPNAFLLNPISNNIKILGHDKTKVTFILCIVFLNCLSTDSI